MQARDVLIRGGAVADGTGAEPVPADVLIRSGRITAVDAPGRISVDHVPVLDASGLVVAPGFIDVHSHADNAPLLAEDDTSKILQGITAEVTGNCGFSLAPVRPASAQDFASFTRRIYPRMDFTWSDWDEFTAVTDARGYVTNVAPLVGHGTLRIAVLGTAAITPDAAQMRTLCRELERALEGGAFGMSTGLIYPPAVFSESDELVQLARCLGPDRPYATHMRGEGSLLFSSIDETLGIGEQSGCRVHISHLKAMGRRQWGRMSEALGRLHHAADRGVRVTKDIYPYAASSTMLTALLPPPFLADGNEGVLARLESASERERLAALMTSGVPGWESNAEAVGWDGIMIAHSRSHRYDGHTLGEIARAEGCSPLDTYVRILREERLQATMVLFAMDEDDVRTAFADRDTMVGTDGLPPGTGGKPHPRMFGTFPRILGEYVRKHHVLPLGEAIRRMTSLPCQVFGIPDRGLIRAGYVADLVAFDAGSINHDTNYRDPVRPPCGISWVMQQGHVTVADNSYLGPRRGRRLTPAA
ncbi:N-acyl-D-amino-acid deacylase family protein [Streptomyces hygroscopicus]|uniref:N-acyl-D-amino-acid deacylase family protein n=1 Tax=Streptomyces hygroscopicus TaxID=1912 RepID=UPI0036B5846F